MKIEAQSNSLKCQPKDKFNLDLKSIETNALFQNVGRYTGTFKKPNDLEMRQSYLSLKSSLRYGQNSSFGFNDVSIDQNSIVNISNNTSNRGNVEEEGTKDPTKDTTVVNEVNKGDPK